MIEVSYSREAMRGLLSLEKADRERAIETLDKLASTYEALLVDSRDPISQIIKEAEVSAGSQPVDEPTDKSVVETGAASESPANLDDDPGQPDASGEAEGDGADEVTEVADTVPDEEDETVGDNSEPDEITPEVPTVSVPGTTPLSPTGDICLAPFSQSGDLVVVLNDSIVVLSLIDVFGDVTEASPE